MAAHLIIEEGKPMLRDVRLLPFKSVFALAVLFASIASPAALAQSKKKTSGTTSTQGAPIADFVVDKTAGPAPLIVSFTDASIGEITSWKWQFGDGGTSDLQHPEHTYLISSLGQVTVSLTVTGAGGESTKTIENLIAVERQQLVKDALPDTSVLEDASEILLSSNLSLDFPELDDSIAEFSLQSDASAISATLSENKLTVEIQPNFFGQGTIRVQGEDSMTVITDSVHVTVQPVNDPPAAFSRLQPADGSFIDGSKINFQWSKSQDIDSDSLFYEVALRFAAVDTKLVTPDTIFTIDFRAFNDSLEQTEVNWSVSAKDDSGAVTPATNGEGRIVVQVTPTNLAQEPLPKDFILHQNTPNPFNPETTIRFQLPNAAWARLEIYNVQGRLVRTLFDEHLAAGEHKIAWNGRNQSGNFAGSGVFLYRLQTDQSVRVRKMLLTR